MAGRCGCGGTGCSCNIQNGQGTTVSGIGTESDPFVINADLARLSQILEFTDTSSIDFTVTGDGAIGSKMFVSAIVKPQPFPAYATGGRPSAVSAGAGAFIYDTGLTKPLWSDGAVWRDAAGTAV